MDDFPLPPKESRDSPRHGFQGDRGPVPPPAEFPAGLTLAVSREAGSRGGSIGRRAARKLGWQVYDQELLEYVSQDGPMHQELIDGLPAGAAVWLGQRLEQLQREQSVSQHPSILRLARAILALAAQGGVVLIGRGAGLLLPAETTLHVRVLAPLADRVAYIGQWLRLTDEEAAERGAAARRPAGRVPGHALPPPARRAAPVRPAAEFQPSRRGIVRRSGRRGRPRKGAAVRRRVTASDLSFRDTMNPAGASSPMSTPLDFTAFAEAARAARPALALVLGSGMGSVAGRMHATCAVPFAEVPELPAAAVAGHRGRLTLGEWAGRNVLVFEGRVHFYEGHPWRAVTATARAAAFLGARALLLTNAAGGIRDDLGPGSLMAIRAHLEWTRPYCWRRPDPPPPSPYSAPLLRLLDEAAIAAGVALPVGVYAMVTGPCFETPAEIRALRACGADAVGMSTAPEAAAGAEAGLECAAVSCITNRAAGLADGSLNHEEVLTTAARQSDAPRRPARRVPAPSVRSR